MKELKTNKPILETGKYPSIFFGKFLHGLKGKFEFDMAKTVTVQGEPYYVGRFIAYNGDKEIKREIVLMSVGCDFEEVQP